VLEWKGPVGDETKATAMNNEFSVQDMSVAEKLIAMEKLWDSLRDVPGNVPSPAWHQEVLEERERRLASGEATVSSLKEVRKRLETLGQ